MAEGGQVLRNEGQSVLSNLQMKVCVNVKSGGKNVNQFSVNFQIAKS
jgi:hypothetical protein